MRGGGREGVREERKRERREGGGGEGRKELEGEWVSEDKRFSTRKSCGRCLVTWKFRRGFDRYED